MMYDISEVSRLFSISPSGLRYYEEQGLISPMRTESGRRKYTEADLQGLLFLRSMHELGISTEETKRYFHYSNQSPTVEAGEVLLERAEEMEKKAAYYRVLARCLRVQGEKLHRAEERAGFAVECVPDYYLLTLEPFFGHGEAEQRDVAKWLDMSPMVQICTEYVCRRGQIVQKKRGLGVPCKEADVLGLPLRERARVMPARLSYNRVEMTEGKERYGLEDDDILRICQDAALPEEWEELHVVTKFIHTSMQGGLRKKLYEIWINEVEKA